MNPITLYKFMSAERAKESITEKRIKISLLPDLNDPYEMVPSVVDEAGAPLFEAELVRSHLYNAIDNKWGIICLSKVIDEPLLWSHYGDKHKGIALAFRFPSNSGIVEAAYGKDRVEICLPRNRPLGPELANSFERLLGHKYEGWSYEKECRFIVSVNPATEYKGHFWKDLTSDFFSGAVLGCLCHDKEADIKNLLTTHGFSEAVVSRVSMDAKQFRMNLPACRGGD